MSKDSYDTSAKRLSIEKQKEFIRKNLLEGTRKDPSDIKVAFFPGTEALEYRLAYQPLNITPQNITGIEIATQRHSRWRKKGLFHITEKPVDALDFFNMYDGPKFDVISLDYDGFFSENVDRTLEAIAKRQVLNEKGILSLNCYGKRENDLTKSKYLLPLICDAFLSQKEEGSLGSGVSASMHGDKFMTKFYKFLSSLPKEINDEKFEAALLKRFDLKELRNRGIIGHVILDFMIRPFESKALPIHMKHPNFQQWQKEIEKAKEKTSVVKDLDKKFHPVLKQYLKEKGYPESLGFILVHSDLNSYYLENMRSYSYISDSGAEMFNNIFFFDQKREIFNKYKHLQDKIFTPDFPVGLLKEDLVSKLEKEGRMLISAGSVVQALKFQRKIREEIDKIKGIEGEIRKDANVIFKSTSSISQRVAKCIPLGSSFKPIIKSKEKLREIVSAGLSREEIESQFRISKNIRGSLNAYIAHRTMGSYKEEKLESNSSILPSSKNGQENHENKDYRQTHIVPENKFQRLIKRGNISENAALRINYFKEDIELSERKRKELYRSISDSNWYMDLENRSVNDIKIYAFFDDLMLEVKRGNDLNKKRVRNIWNKILQSDKLYTSVIYDPKSKKESIHNLTAEENRNVYELIERGVSDKEIARTYGLNQRQIGARKAWITMKRSS